MLWNIPMCLPHSPIISVSYIIYKNNSFITIFIFFLFSLRLLKMCSMKYLLKGTSSWWLRAGHIGNHHNHYHSVCFTTDNLQIIFIFPNDHKIFKIETLVNIKLSRKQTYAVLPFPLFTFIPQNFLSLNLDNCFPFP